jgi:hypothetical protein
MTWVEITTDSVRIDELETRDPDVVDFFTELRDDSRADLADRAVSLGVVGLRAMGVAGHVELVEREFLKLQGRFDEGLRTVQDSLQQRITSTFDPDQAESVSARLSATISDANHAATDVVREARGELEKLISDSFNPDLATSCIYRIGKLIADTRAELDRAFDPAYQGSHLARLVELVNSYFGTDGALRELIAAQVTPVRDEVLAAIQGMRDAVVGQAVAAAERDRSPASGIDFEDEVEDVLCGLARAYGDTVERVGNQAGDTGRSKRGDFVVQLASGHRFVVEAKKRATPLPLRGDRGLLAVLDDSMLNRAASFAIVVAKDESAFATEVGAFGDYDGDKVLCRIGERGELLQAAYRWARASLLAASAADAGIDTAAVSAGIEEARRALREVARIEGKAKAIAQGADDIKSIVAFQVRRLHTALDEAAAGLTHDAARVAS